MKSDFLKYLFYVVLIAVFFVALFAVIIIRLKKEKAVIRKPKEIDSGNISVFFDKEENVVIIPYIKDKFGMGRATINVEFLNKPYTAEKLGSKVRNTMISCQNSEACSDIELMTKLGFRGWREFSEGKRNISIHFQKGRGVVFNTTIRKQDGAYQFNYPSFEEIINNDLFDKELGEKISLLLQKCRC